MRLGQLLTVGLHHQLHISKDKSLALPSPVESQGINNTTTLEIVEDNSISVTGTTSVPQLDGTAAGNQKKAQSVLPSTLITETPAAIDRKRNSSEADDEQNTKYARYRLTLKCVDPNESASDTTTPSIQLVFFGPLAEEIVGAPVHELIACAAEMGCQLPKKIEETYGTTVTVLVGLGKLSFGNFGVSFLVRNIMQIAPNIKGTQELPQTVQPQESTTEDKQQSSSVQQEQALPKSQGEDVAALHDISTNLPSTPNLTTPAATERKRTKRPDNDKEPEASTRTAIVSAKRKLDVDDKNKQTSKGQHKRTE